MNDESLALEHGTLAYLRGGTGPLVVFSHALGPLAWGPLDRLMAACTVAVPDWERSTVPASTMGELGWFETLVAAMGFERAALCAWSMAGPAAVYFAAGRPACLSCLVLVDVAGLRPDLPPLRLRDLPHLALTRLVGHPTRGLVRAMWRNWVRREDVDTGPLEEATYRFFRAGEPEDPTDEDDGDTVMDVLPDVEVPTLVLSGRHSSVLGPHYGRVAAALLPRGEHVVFEESSHALQLEEREHFQDALAAFLTGGSAASRDRVTVRLDRDLALTFFEWSYRFLTDHHPAFQHPADAIAVDQLSGELECALAEPSRADYARLLADARERALERYREQMGEAHSRWLERLEYRMDR